jgi:large subunit ribosomal protein L25
MEQIALQAERRNQVGKRVRQLRREGRVPGVLYGAGKDALNLHFAQSELDSVLRLAGRTHIITLQIQPDGGEQPALVREVEINAVRRNVTHIDLLRLVMDEKITTETGIVLVGKPPVGCYVVKDLNSVMIECLPNDMIGEIEVDVSKLAAAGDHIRIRDLDFPPGVTVLADEEETLAHAVEFGREAAEPKAEGVIAGEVPTVAEARSPAG